MRLYKAVAIITLLASLAAPIFGCAQMKAVFPFLDKVEQIVANDIAAGKGLTQIEEDVAASLVGQVGVDVVVVVNDALAILVDTGVLPAHLLGTAQTLKAQEAKRVALGVHRVVAP